MATVYDFTVKDRKGNEVSLKDYEGKVLLIVNTATGCGFTPHYDPLEAMYKEYRDQGFEILDFPCNQFANQAPGSEDEIHEFCTMKNRVSAVCKDRCKRRQRRSVVCVSCYGKTLRRFRKRHKERCACKVFGYE